MSVESVSDSEIGRRNVRPISLAGLTPSMADVPPPEFEWVSPSDLLVDESYQRNLSERSIKLIRQIIGSWDWRRFKPPICARTVRGLEVIDGQHTAVAAASHPDVTSIPVVVVRAAAREDRAQAFMGHNRDRLGITKMQLHFAAVAAGDEEAQTIDQVCARAGARILRTQPGNGVWKPGETVAVAAIGALISKRHAAKARQVIEVLVKAGCSPILASQIKAVDMLLHEKEYAGEVLPEDLVTAIIKTEATADQEAAVFAAAHKVPIWRALGVVWFRKARKRGR